MTRHNLLPLLAVALLGAVLAAGCGSGKKSVGANDVAVVGDRSISKQEFQKLLDQACATTKSQGQKCPQAGTEQYTALRKQAMQYLVQRAEFEQKADDLGLKITDADVEAQLLKIKAQYFGKGGKCDANCEKKYRDQIAKQRLTDEQVHADVRANVIQNKIYEKVTADVEVSDKEIEDYVRHILVKKKSLADQLHQRLLSGADFAALAKKYSEDPSSKTQGGKLTVSKGRQVPEFDKAAFSLKTREISEPIKTQYGWHIIQPLSAIKNERKTPLKEVRPAIRQQLVQQKKQDKMRKWVDETTKDFESKTSFQVGYALPATTGTTPATP